MERQSSNAQESPDNLSRFLGKVAVVRLGRGGVRLGWDEREIGDEDRNGMIALAKGRKLNRCSLALPVHTDVFSIEVGTKHGQFKRGRTIQ